MCQYSLEGYPSRDAKNDEILQLRRLDGFRFSSHIGFFGGTTRTNSKLVCVKPGASLTLERVVIVNDLRLNRDYAPIFAQAARWRDKTDVVVTMTSWSTLWSTDEHYSDALEFPDGVKLHLVFFAPGMRAHVGMLPQKATKQRDLNRALGLDQIRAKVPKETAREAAPASAD